MLCKYKKNVLNILANIATAAAITACVLPGFELIGNLFAQVFVTAACALVIILIADRILKREPKIIAYSLITMTVFWIMLAMIKQINLHIAENNCSLKWLHLFYYDRPAMLFIVFFIAILYYVAVLFSKSGNSEFLKCYSIFIKKTTICLLIYYFIILVYCFYLTRQISEARPQINLIPFDTIVTTFNLGRVDYELLFLFLGNIAIFFPLGIFICALINGRITVVLFPLFLSIGIELSQYLLGNGHPDIDDIILNVLGFYVGVSVKLLSDKLIKKASKGKIESVFIFDK